MPFVGAPPRPLKPGAPPAPDANYPRSAGDLDFHCDPLTIRRPHEEVLQTWSAARPPAQSSTLLHRPTDRGPSPEPPMLPRSTRNLVPLAQRRIELRHWWLGTTDMLRPATPPPTDPSARGPAPNRRRQARESPPQSRVVPVSATTSSTDDRCRCGPSMVVPPSPL